MLPWLAFSEAVGRAPSVMLEHRNFVKKLVFAVETLPVNLVTAGLVTEVLRDRSLLRVPARDPPRAPRLALLWLPVLLIPQILFTAGISWFLAALGVFVRDLGQIIGFVLTLWFFLDAHLLSRDPNCPDACGCDADEESDLHSGARLPRHFPAEPGARTSARSGSSGCWRSLVFVLGHAWFYKLRKSFPDLL